MKYQKLVDELSTVIEATSHCRQQHQDTLMSFLVQFKAEEEKLSKELKKATNEESRGKWERKLGLVREAYDILEA